MNFFFHEQCIRSEVNLMTVCPGQEWVHGEWSVIDRDGQFFVWTQSGPLEVKRNSWRLSGKRPLDLTLLVRFRRRTFSRQCCTWNCVYPQWRGKCCFCYLWGSARGEWLEILLWGLCLWQCHGRATHACVPGARFCVLGDPTSDLSHVWKPPVCFHEPDWSLGYPSALFFGYVRKE